MVVVSVSVCVCQSLCRGRGRICCETSLCPVELFPSAMCFLKIFGKWDPSVSQFASLRYVLSVQVVSRNILVMNCLCCSSWCLLKMSSFPHLFLVTSDEIQVPAPGNTRNANGEVLQADQCSSHSIMPQILFITLSCTLKGAKAAPECLLR